MEFIKAETGQEEVVFAIVKSSVEAVYPAYYPEEIIRFFLELHGKENIKKDIEGKTADVCLLCDGGQFVATGTLERRHISRVYVLPECRGKGYGAAMMEWLEKRASESVRDVIVEASLPSCGFYERRGYREIRGFSSEENEAGVPAYRVMRKKLERS